VLRHDCVINLYLDTYQSHVLRKASAIKSKSTSSCEVMPRLTGESSASSPVTLTECETEREIRHDVRETVAVDLDAKNDVDMAENTPQSEVVDMGGSDDDKEPEIEFRYEKIGTYSFPPTIVSEAEAAFVDIITVLFLRHS